LRFGCALDRGSDNRRGGGEPLGLVLFQALDCQLELLSKRNAATLSGGA
jgi:hypothetical protein